MANQNLWIEGLSTAVILSALIDMDEAPWGDLKGNPLDSRQLANLLNHYGVNSETLVTPLDQRNFYARIFRPAVNAAKLEDGVGWHTLRHTFASRLAMSGLTEGTIAALMRHSTTALVRRYAHLSPSYLHAAVETVAAYGKPSVKSEPNSIGTVTETGNTAGSGAEKQSEVIEKVGAGDGI